MSQTDQSQSQIGDILLVIPEHLLPIVYKYFDRISAAQWNLLAAGTCDSDTEATLVDMFTEIVQTISAQVLRYVLPLFQERMLNRASGTSDVLVLPDLEVSIAETFADAFQVPQEKCESAEKLTELVRTEILEKVISLVSVATGESFLPREPAIFVSSSTFSIMSLRDMVRHATTCLKTYLGKLNSQCLGLQPESTEFSPHESTESGEQYTERCKSSQSVKSKNSQSERNTPEMKGTQTPGSCDSIKSKFSVPSVTEAVSDILTKWSSDTVDTKAKTGKALVSLSPSPNTHDLAVEIVNDIIDGLHYPDFGDVAECSETSTSQRPHFNLEIVLNKVKDFFATHATPKEDTTNIKFSKFVKKQFEKRVEELKSLFATNKSNFLVSLKQSSEEEIYVENPLPESTRPTSACSQTSKRSSPLDFETIKSEVEAICDELKLTKKQSTHSTKIPNCIMSSGKIRTFAKELTDKMYDHMIRSRTYHRPSVPDGKSLSDSVISQLRLREHGTLHHFSPEVLYAMTEDAVVKFLQQVSLWMENEPSYEKSHSDEVFGVLTDIEDLITTTLQEENTGPEPPEASDNQTTARSLSSYPSPATLITIRDDESDGLNVRDHNDSQLLMRRKFEEATDNIILPPEDSRAIVNKYFNRISVTQWSLLAAGTYDVETVATLADMLIEIIQTHSAGVLAMVRERMCRSDSQADVSKALENLNIRLGVSFSDSFADALHVPQEKCESAEKLTEMVEREISQKVTSLVSVATKTSVLPEEPAVFVSSSMSSSTVLHSMVLQAIACLKNYLSKLCCHPKSTDFVIEISKPEEPEQSESCQSIKSKISVISVTKAVSDILTKWSTDTPDLITEANNDTIPVSTGLDAEFIASEIANDIINDLHSSDLKDIAGCSDNSTSTGPQFNLGKTVSKVKDFFTSQAGHEEDTAHSNQIFNKHSFSEFLKNQHEKTLGELKKAFMKEDAAYIVSLEPASEKDGCAEAISTGAIPKSSRSKSACSQTSERTIHVLKKSSTVDFETIKNDVETLFNKLNLTGTPATHMQKRLHNIMSSDEIRKFSKELTDKMYDNLMDTKTYERPIFQVRKCLSDSVISQRRRDTTTQFRLSPEVLYVMTENAVRKFLQHVFLWMENAPSHKTCEQVSGAVTDINHLITTLQEEINIGRQQSPEASNSQTTARSHPSQLPANPANHAAPKEDLTPEFLEARDRQMPSPVVERTMNSIILALLYKVFIKGGKEARRRTWPQYDFDSVVNRLRDKVLDEIDVDEVTAEIITEKMKEINKAMMKDLTKEFGSPRRLLRVAMVSSSYPSFDDAVVKYLKIHLNDLISPRPKMPRVARIFSAVGKAITKYFTCCMSVTYSE